MAPHSQHSDEGVPEYPTSHPVVDVDVDVLIVGGGPSGLLLAHMLSQLKVSALVIERYKTRLDAPKAHALSPRSLELCRQFGIDVNEIRKLGTKRVDAYWVNFLTSLNGHYAGCLPYERMDMEVLADTPHMIHNIPQPTFEELVAARLRADGQVEVRKNHSYVSCKQYSDRVVTTIEDRSTARLYQITSKQVVGCDGARSKVRESLGIGCQGESSNETMMTIHFNANLRPIMGEHIGMLHWIMDPEVSGFIISYDSDNNQVLICNSDPRRIPSESWDMALCRKTITAAIGTSVPFDILSFRPWVLSSKVAETYQVGRVFLAGDAAHSFPPTGGLGLNSGLGDVHNLAYKIAAVNQGWANEKIFNTYESERRPVALVNAQQSVKNGKKIFLFLQSLGATDENLETAKQNLYHKINSAQNRSSLLHGIDDQREHFNNHGLHIGYVYGNAAIPSTASLFTPSYRPGARLPHAWLSLSHLPACAATLPPIDTSYVAEMSAEDVRLRQYSTLDLCASDAFTLLVHAVSATQWRGNLMLARKLLAMSVQKIVKINLLVMGEDFNLLPGARAEEWARGLQLANGAAILVRPDQHILDTFGKDTTPEQFATSLLGQLGF